MKSILINDTEIISLTDNISLNRISDFSENEREQITDVLVLIDYKTKLKNIIPVPEEQNVYTMMSPCPVRSDLVVKIWDINYKNNKQEKVIKIDIIALHFDQNGVRVPQYDNISYVMADMSEERRVEIIEGVYEYSYILASTMLENNTPMSQLIAMTIQIADADGTLNKRLYNLEA